MINTLTLNPAVDKILYVDKFEKNITTRIKRVLYTIGGKGTHVSINLSIMGEKNNAFGWAHGAVGKQVMEMLGEYEGVNVCFNYKDEQNTRTNYLLNEKNGDSTLITEKGAQLSKEDLDATIEKLRENMHKGDFLALSGDASNYADPYVYNYILEALSDMELKVFLDSSGASLKKCLDKKPFLIKPNADELSMICDRHVEEETNDVVDAIKSLDKYDINVIAVSLGGKGSVVKYYDRYFEVKPPKINVRNTVGCGDCYLSGLLYGFSKGMEIEDILSYATAVSAATAESELSVGFDIKRAQELIGKAQIKEL